MPDLEGVWGLKSAQVLLTKLSSLVLGSSSPQEGMPFYMFQALYILQIIITLLIFCIGKGRPGGVR